VLRCSSGSVRGLESPGRGSSEPPGVMARGWWVTVFGPTPPRRCRPGRVSLATEPLLFDYPPTAWNCRWRFCAAPIIRSGCRSLPWSRTGWPGPATPAPGTPIGFRRRRCRPSSGFIERRRPAGPGLFLTRLEIFTGEPTRPGAGSRPDDSEFRRGEDGYDGYGPFPGVTAVAAAPLLAGRVNRAAPAAWLAAFNRRRPLERESRTPSSRSAGPEILLRLDDVDQAICSPSCSGSCSAGRLETVHRFGRVHQPPLEPLHAGGR